MKGQILKMSHILAMTIAVTQIYLLKGRLFLLEHTIKK